MHNVKLNGQKMKDGNNLTPLNYAFFSNSYYSARRIFCMCVEIAYQLYGQSLYKGSI